MAQHVYEKPGGFSVYWAVMDDSPIKKISDLKGKTVGISVIGGDGDDATHLPRGLDDPADGAVISASTVTVAGRAPGAATVKVAGVNATVADASSFSGSFVAMLTTAPIALPG